MVRSLGALRALLIVALCCGCAMGGPRPGTATGQRLAVATGGERAILQTRGPVFTSVTARNLDGEAVELPAALPADRSVVLVAFTLEQESAIRGWVRALGIDRGTRLPWLGIAAPNPNYEIFASSIETRMRSVLARPGDRTRIVALYDRVDLMAGLQLLSDREPVVMVATREGDILTIERGNPTPDKLRRITTLL